MGMSEVKIVAMTKFVVGFLPRTHQSIFSDDCICTSCGAALGTFTLRKLECFKYELVVNNTLLWNEARLATCFVGLRAMADG